MAKLLMEDDLNRRLVALLQQDGRMSHAELAERLGVSRPTIIDRVKRLEADGVLGGYAHVSGPDAAASIRFIGALRSSHAEFGRRAAVDCGSGIGRVAKTVLCPLFDSVDLVEQSPRLLGAAREAGAARGDGRYLCTGLQVRARAGSVFVYVNECVCVYVRMQVHVCMCARVS